MDVLETRLAGPVLLEPRAFADERGFFLESYRRSAFEELGIEPMVQDNHSRSRRGVVRGIHFQLVERGASKLVRCARGAILDVVVDLRAGSPTFAAWEAFELNDANLHQLYVPHGFGHAFCVLSDVADVLYKQSAYYDAAAEAEISYRDPDIAIAWPEGVDLMASPRDEAAPTLGELAGRLPFRWAAP